MSTYNGSAQALEKVIRNGNEIVPTPDGGITFTRLVPGQASKEGAGRNEDVFNKRQNLADSIKGSRVLMKNHQIHQQAIRNKSVTQKKKTELAEKQQFIDYAKGSDMRTGSVETEKIPGALGRNVHKKSTVTDTGGAHRKPLDPD